MSTYSTPLNTQSGNQPEHRESGLDFNCCHSVTRISENARLARSFRINSEVHAAAPLGLLRIANQMAQFTMPHQVFRNPIYRFFLISRAAGLRLR
jgi:hypothetical protein